MTPQEVKQEITIRFGVLLNRGMLKATIKGKVLTLSGKIEAVQAMDRHVMEKYVPNHCKMISRSESCDNFRGAHGKGQPATYTYKFERISDVYS